MERILTESKKFTITNEYEVVFLNFKNEDRKIIIGDFYGDPEFAFISAKEDYCIVTGCGIIIYYLKEPFETYEYSSNSKQWNEFLRNESSVWWIEEIEEKDSKTIKFVASNNEDDELHRFVINLSNNELQKIGL